VKIKVFLFALIFTIVAAGQADAASYRVRSGDNLWRIAFNTGSSVPDLIAYNPSIKANPGRLYVGQVLAIPEGGPEARQVAKLVNAERAKAGLPALKLNWELSRVALHKAQDMAIYNYMSHTSRIYGSPFDMMKNYGIRYTTAGENIAKGQRTPDEVMRAWMNSSGHRNNIMSSQFNTLGVGYYKGAWVQMFIKK
jgi:uncharacterized YkwD family protein